MSPSHDQPGADHFDFGEYATKARWNSYWHQLDESFAARPKTALVVGGGDAVVPHVLRSAGVGVTVVDVVDELDPDVVADVRDLPFDADAFDVTLCCQVLEHIPFDTVAAGLAELRRVSSKRVVVSLPDRARKFSIDIRIAGKKHLRKRVEQSRKKETWAYDGVHHWEIGSGNYPVGLVREAIGKEFTIEQEYLVDENTYHRFFVLQPK